MSDKKRKKSSVALRVLRYIGRYRWLLLFSVLMATVAVATTLYVPILIGRAIDLMVGKGQVDFSAISEILLQIIALIGITAVSQWLMNTANNRITYHVIRDVRNDACRKIQRLPLSYLDSHRSGDVVSRVIADVDQFAEGLLMGFTQFFSGVATIIGTLICMLILRVDIAILVVLLTPISLLLARFIAKRTHHLFTAQSQKRGEQTALIDEIVGGARVVRAFGYEERAKARFEVINENLTQTSLKATFFSSLVNPTTRFVNSLIYAAIALCGALAVIGSGGTLTIGVLSSLLSYTTQYTKPFNEISGTVTELQNSLACASRVFELLDQPSEIPDKPDAVQELSAKGAVSLKDVSFSYTPEQSLIEGLSLSVAAGKRIAIVGPTGCGKTTLINLLMRFYDVNRGEIAVDDIPIQNMTRHALRKNYGMVLQDTWLRAGTVRENIAMGCPDATEQEIVAAARAAHAHSFIMRLPQGYDTVLTENGENLSAGQKQLLCIARVMLDIPPMLILDEATSSIDTRTEIRIQKAFSTMMQGRTSFIVAHRLSTIQEADLILVMRSGNVVEMGTHEQLLAAKGFYSVLYNSQFEAV